MTTEPRSCRRATELISRSLDEPLTRRERFALRRHLLICRPCRAFRRQLGQLRAMLRDPLTPRLPTSYMDTVLSDAARARIKAALHTQDGPD